MDRAPATTVRHPRRARSWLVAGLAVLGAACARPGAGTTARAPAPGPSVDQQATDLEIKSEIVAALLAGAPRLAGVVNVDVDRQRVMLTGVVPSQMARTSVVVIARGVAGVQELHDDIDVAGPGAGGDAAADAAINQALGRDLRGARGLESARLRHRVVNGTAFILGRAQEQGQIDAARAVALATPGVRRVVMHVDLF